MFQLSDQSPSDLMVELMKHTSEPELSQFPRNQEYLNAETVVDKGEIESWDSVKGSPVLVKNVYDARTGERQNMYECVFCGKFYLNEKKLNAHQRKDCGAGPRLQCPHCSVSIRRRANWLRHIRHFHST